MENPLVMKAPSPNLPLSSFFVKSDFRFSFSPTSSLRFLRACSSSRALAVRVAVAAFLMPFVGLGVDVLEEGLAEEGIGVEV